MQRSLKSALPLSKPGRAKRGEIALTLTIISMGIMLIGTMFGAVQQQQRTSSKAAGCSYKAIARVRGVDSQGKPITLATGGLGTTFGVRNDFSFLPFVQDGFIVHRTVDTKNFTFPPYHEPNPLPDKATATIDGLNTASWQIKNTFCENQPGGLGGCTRDTADTNGKRTITNIDITCGVNMIYGWDVVPNGETSQSEPTPTSRPLASPTAQAGIPTPTSTQSTNSCFFNPTAYVKLQLDNRTEIPLDVKVEQNVTAWKFTNNALVASTFAATGSRSFTEDVSKLPIFAGRQYCCGTQNDPAGWYSKRTYLVGKIGPNFNDGDSAKVTLSNYVPLSGENAVYEIVKKCDKFGCSTSGQLDRIDGLKVGCSNPASSYSYWWVLKCTGQDCYRPLPIKTPTLTPTPVQVILVTNPPYKRIPISPTTVPTQIPTQSPDNTPTSRPTSIPTPLPSGYRAQYISAFCTNKDAYVLGLNALKNTNYGNNIRLFVGGRPGNSNLYTPYRSYIQFDLRNEEFMSRKPIIRKVELGLSDTDDSVQSYPEKLKFPLSVKIVQQPWDESTITWNSQPSNGSIIATQFINNERDITRFNLPASLVQEWVDNPSSNNGLQIVGTEDETIEDVPVRTFYASEEYQQNPAVLPRSTCMRVEYDRGAQQTPVKSPLARLDLNGDKTVNVVDFVLFLKKIGSKGANIPEDVNKDRVVNAVDGASIMVNFGKKVE